MFCLSKSNIRFWKTRLLTWLKTKKLKTGKFHIFLSSSVRQNLQHWFMLRLTATHNCFKQKLKSLETVTIQERIRVVSWKLYKQTNCHFQRHGTIRKILESGQQRQPVQKNYWNKFQHKFKTLGLKVQQAMSLAQRQSLHWTIKTFKQVVFAFHSPITKIILAKAIFLSNRQVITQNQRQISMSKRLKSRTYT